MKVGTLHERKILLKKYQSVRSFLWATPVNLINKINEMLFQKVQQRYTRLINTVYFRSFIIDQSWNTLQLKYIVLSFHPSFWANHCSF